MGKIWRKKNSCFENRRPLEDHLKTNIFLVVVCAEKKTQSTSMSEREILLQPKNHSRNTQKTIFMPKFFKIMPKNKRIKYK